MKVQNSNKKTFKASKKNKTIYKDTITWWLSDFLPVIYIRSQEAKFWSSEESNFEPRNLTTASLLIKCEGEKEKYIQTWKDFT